MSETVEAPAWHQALAYAVTGRRHPELGRQASPDLPALAGYLRVQVTDLDELRGSYPVSADLAEGLGAAQLWAAVSQLRTLLDLDRRPVVPGAINRPPTADELRLLREVPPHHGS